MYLHLKIRVVGGRVGGWVGVVVSGQQTLYKEMIWCAIIIIMFHWTILDNANVSVRCCCCSCCVPKPRPHEASASKHAGATFWQLRCFYLRFWGLGLPGVAAAGGEPGWAEAAAATGRPSVRAGRKSTHNNNNRFSDQGGEGGDVMVVVVRDGHRNQGGHHRSMILDTQVSREEGMHSVCIAIDQSINKEKFRKLQE